jgi:DNA-binding NtrC family response regulator/tetratricopeptide (TPR) repeat protein
MRLLADRFVDVDGARVVDLATGADMWFVRLPHAGAVEAADWQTARLDEWRRGTDLIDFGWEGPLRFEARAAAPPAGGRRLLDAVPGDERLGPLVEALEHTLGHGPRNVHLRSSPGTSTATWLACARTLRLHGVVPVGMRPAVDLRFGTILRGRSVGLLCLGDSGWRRSAEGGDEVRALARLAAAGARLAVTVQPCGPVAPVREDLATLAARRDVRSLGGASLAAEGASHDHLVASRLYRSGRQAAAIRRLEAALARGVRRDAGAASIEGRVVLAGWWVARGELARAERVLGAVIGLDGRAAPAGLVEATRLLGLVRLEQARLDEAERLLRFAVEEARCTEAPDLRASAALSLARCLFWQGRYADARECLAPGVAAGGPMALRALTERWLARLALAEGDTTLALRSVRTALAHLPAEGDEREEPSLHLAVALEAMRVRGALGDGEGVAARWPSARRIARRCARPARVRAWLAYLDAASAIEDGRAVTEAVDGLRGAAGLPPFVAARVRQALETHGQRRSTNARRFLAARGVVTPPVSAGTRGGARVFDDLMELIAWCQEADDERHVLDRVCARVRERLRASVVSLVADPDRGRTLAGAGQARYAFGETARRALTTGAAVGACRVNDALEAAVPVRWGGSAIAALSCRWPLDVEVDEARVKPLLEGAAVACAPTVRALLDRAAVSGAAEADLGLVGGSRAMALVRELARRAAQAPFPVLVEGESGSGKELVARAIHSCGPRRVRRFAAVNCAALSDDLLEAELFGHTRGAFTGAAYDRVGLFEEADGGTLFLDEVGELSARAQAKLLRALQEGEVRRVGENLARRVDVRVVAATNRGLTGDVAHGRFREDLRYRLDVIRIVVPPLRDRPEDLPLLAAHFWAVTTARLGSRATLDPATVEALSGYHWPGNVRELQNVLAAVAVHAPRRGRVGPRYLPPSVAGARVRGPRLESARRTLDADLVRAALARASGSRAKAAAELGLSRQGLGKLMARLGLEIPV